MQLQYDKFDWHDFCDASKNRDVVIFGAAQTGRIFYEKYRGNLNIVKVYDNCYERWGESFGDVFIDTPENMKQYDLENIVCVIASQYWFQIIPQIKKYGIKYYFVYPVFEENKRYEKKQEKVVDCAREKYNWNYKYNCYVHALGVINGVRYTNSFEAFEYSLNCGFKMFEMDLSLVNMEVVLCHTDYCMKNIQYIDGRATEKNVYNSYDETGWPYSFEQLNKEKIYGKFTPLKFVDVCKCMEKYNDMHLILHLHYRNSKERKLLIDSISNIIKDYNDEFKNRIVLQVFSKEMLEEAESSENFKNYTYFFEFIPMRYIKEKSEECGINTIVTEYRAIDDGFVNFFHNNGYKIAVYGACKNEDLLQLKKMGVDIFCLENAEMLEEMQ